MKKGTYGIAWLAVELEQPFTRPGGRQAPLASVQLVLFARFVRRLAFPVTQVVASASRLVPVWPPLVARVLASAIWLLVVRGMAILGYGLLYWPSWVAALEEVLRKPCESLVVFGEDFFYPLLRCAAVGRRHPGMPCQ